MAENTLSLKNLQEQYKYDNQLMKYSERHYRNDNRVYGSVNCNDDVTRHRNYLVNSLKTYKKISPLVQDDIKDIESAMGRYEIAVRKVIATCTLAKSEFNYQPEELQDLINDVFIQQENVNKLLMRKLFQD